MFSNVNKVTEAELADDLLALVQESSGNSEMLRNLTSTSYIIESNKFRGGSSVTGCNKYTIQVPGMDYDALIAVIPTQLNDTEDNYINRDIIARANFDIITKYISNQNIYEVTLVTESLLPSRDIFIDLVQIPIKSSITSG